MGSKQEPKNKKIVFDNGDKYEGKWFKDKAEKEGTYIEKSTGNTYKGN